MLDFLARLDIIWLYIIITIFLLILGITSILSSIRTFKTQLYFCREFIDKFTTYKKSIYDNNENHEVYLWLVGNSAKMQREIGGYGIMSHMIDGNFQYRNFQIILNLIPRIREIHRETSGGYGLRFEYLQLEKFIAMIGECLIRYDTELNYTIGNLTKELTNPFVWLRKGIQSIVTFPIIFFHWTGVIQYSSYSKLSDNFFVKFISSSIVIIGFISSIITIVTGFNPFVDITNKIFNN
ncbi:hypothetical protein [Paenibacillus sp. sgz302251]|uniref:hypothetical protein n=1 Tax=Paenibacillus sp. sgz302251 TaxID=3414493 RepID=UPI003C7CE56A